MFEAVVMSVLAHSYAHVAPLKKDLLGYSLGPLPAVREATGADAVLFVYAVDHVLAPEVHMVNVMLAIASGGMFRVTGGLVVPIGGSFTLAVDPNLIVAALVDSQTGDILWLAWRHWQSEDDLRKASSAESLAGMVFDDLAASRRK